MTSNFKFKWNFKYILLKSDSSKWEMAAIIDLQIATIHIFKTHTMNIFIYFSISIIFEGLFRYALFWWVIWFGWFDFKNYWFQCIFFLVKAIIIVCTFLFRPVLTIDIFQISIEWFNLFFFFISFAIKSFQLNQFIMFTLMMSHCFTYVFS